MSPTLKTFFVTLSSLALLNCGGGESSPSSTATLHAGTTAVTMQLDFPETPLVDSLVVDCRGADTLHYSRKLEVQRQAVRQRPPDATG